eukprot:569170-Prymnesium_polylepis.1
MATPSRWPSSFFHTTACVSEGAVALLERNRRRRIREETLRRCVVCRRNDGVKKLAVPNSARIQRLYIKS